MKKTPSFHPFSFFALKNYFGDYSHPIINQKKYEEELPLAGGTSNTEVYVNCIRIINEKIKKNGPIRILDIGCGDGNFGKECKKRNQDYIIDGIDLYVPEKKHLTEMGIYHRIFEKDISAGDFGTHDTYDIVVGNQFLEHLAPGDAIIFLKKISSAFEAVLLSVPLPYQTFAYTEDYLLASCKAHHEFPEEVYPMAVAEIHKSYITKKLMSSYGFRVVGSPVYFSYFFLKEHTVTPPESLPAFKEVTEPQIEKALASFYTAHQCRLPRPPTRYAFEKLLMRSVLLEPVGYKILRRIIHVCTAPLRSLKRKTTS